MTEKRFTLIRDTGTDEVNLDNLYDNNTFVGAVGHSGSDMICYLLNSLNDDNKKLKEKNMQLTLEVETLKQIKPLRKLSKNKFNVLKIDDGDVE